MITAYVNHPKFQAICASLSNEDAEKVVACFPDLFRDALEFGAPTEPTGPTVAKTQPKAPAADRAAVDAEVLRCVKASPGERSATIATAVRASLCLDNTDAVNAAVLRSLNAFVKAGKMYKDGEHKSARFKMVPDGGGAGEVAE